MVTYRLLKIGIERYGTYQCDKGTEKKVEGSRVNHCFRVLSRSEEKPSCAEK